jgi:hypothetical protein
VIGEGRKSFAYGLLFSGRTCNQISNCQRKVDVSPKKPKLKRVFSPAVPIENGGQPSSASGDAQLGAIQSCWGSFWHAVKATKIKMRCPAIERPFLLAAW